MNMVFKGIIVLLGVVAVCAGYDTLPPNKEPRSCCSRPLCGSRCRDVYYGWGSCSVTCGGGTQTRTVAHVCACLKFSGCEDKTCNSWTETRDCNQNCFNGGTYQSGCQCTHLFYGYCCELDCPKIQYCSDNHYGCDTGPPSICTQCQQYAGSHYSTSAYWLNNNKCTPRCNWLNHWCWPGTCDTSNEYLASTCNCIQGFQKVTPNVETTKCELTEPPIIETCRLGIEGPNGEAANSSFVGNTTSCGNTRDTYVNFQPSELFLAFEFSLILPVEPPKDPERHNYVESYHFGIVEATAQHKYYDTTGSTTTLTTLDMASQADCTDNSFGRSDPVDGLISCQMVHQYKSADVKDGSKLCHRFEPSASGYVRIRNIVDQSVSGKNLYAVTKTDAEKCFRFDFTSAKHCKGNSTPCAYDPLDIGPRVQRHQFISARYHGYYDPYPSSTVTGPSGIDHYLIQIHNMQLAGDHLFVDHKVIVDYETTHDVTEFDFELPQTGEPMMYCIVLTTLDVAGNFRMARRFVIYDNTSYLALETEHHSLSPISANPATGYLWQVSHDPIIVDWQEYFYNVHHKHFNFLLPIRENSNVTGIYEQLEEPIPVTGTPNVHGIVTFMYQYDHTSPSVNKSVPLQKVSNVLDQQVTITDLDLRDGDTVDVTVLAIDMMNNTIDDSFRMYIDASPPELLDLGLSKDGEKIFVHDSKDLRSMNFTFEAHDPHSSLHQVKWKLGSYSGGGDISSGALPVVRIFDQEQCEENPRCYCPIIGNCSLLAYNIELKEAIDDGDHNREYFFWIEVVNKALLRSEEVIKILVDDSPPEVGVVIDGPAGSTDRDYQAENVLEWHWRSFIDHESGISKYQFVVSHQCYTMEEMVAENVTADARVLHFGETDEQHASFEVSGPGTYHLSVIAFNNALDPSKAACSSGVTVDHSAPVLKHVYLPAARTQPSIACSHNNSIWHITSSFTAQPLAYVAQCERHCHTPIDVSIFHQEIHWSNNGTIIFPPQKKSEELCYLLPTFQPEHGVFLATDNLEISWKFEEHESQVKDFFVGLSTSRNNSIIPDFIYYLSTHNKTHFKCSHCGVGEGQRFFFQVKAENKAHLTSAVGIGPVVIDFTPPVYQGGMGLEVQDDELVLTWNADSFIDNEDTATLTEYHWALGTTRNPQEVQSWTPLQIPISNITSDFVFIVTYELSRLQAHDQEHGKTYNFFIRSFNRAGSSTTVPSSDYKIPSNIAPSSGRIHHISVNSTSYQDIAFQTRDDVLCAYWTGFSHHDAQFNISLSIGSAPGRSDILPSTEVATEGPECFNGLVVPHLQQSFINIQAVNDKGVVNVSSTGIFVATDDETLHLARVNDRPGCSDEFVELGSDINIDVPEQNVSISTLPSVTYVTLSVQYKWQGDFSPLIIQTLGDTLERYSWVFQQQEVEEYFKVPIHGEDQLVFLSSPVNITVKKIAFSPCLIDQGMQLSTTQLRSSWTLRPEVLPFVSHFEVTVQEFRCTSQGCSIENNQFIRESTPHMDFTKNIQLQPGHSYKTSIRPCFQNSCAGSVDSEGVTVLSNPPVSGIVNCTMKPSLGNGSISTPSGNVYDIEVSWESFQHPDYGLRLPPVSVYDWSLSSSTGSQLIAWQRELLPEGETIVEAHKNMRLLMHDHKSVHLVVRSSSDGHVQSTAHQKCEMKYTFPKLSATVYDLPPNYEHLDDLNDLLHGNQLAKVAQQLHDDEVEFSSDPRRISGAIQGTDCSDHHWWVQLDHNINCKNDPSSSACIREKYSITNVIRFANLGLIYATQYFLCVHASGGSCNEIKVCSNGFIIDTKPPLPGQVSTENGHVLTDNTSVLIYWQGFQDIEADIELGDRQGIKEYFYGLGSHPDHDDLKEYESVGMSHHVLATGLQIQSGRLLYINVKACDHVDLCTVTSSLPIMVDTSPPQPGSLSVYTMHEQQNREEDITVQYGEFHDSESGILSYHLAVGSHVDSQDVLPFTAVTGFVTFLDGRGMMTDGKSYYFHIKATNKVGLWTTATSPPFLYDSSPPSEGFVRFGRPGDETSKYSRDINSLDVNWGGFVDVHSGIMFYRFCVGTQSGMCDVRTWKETGLHTAIHRSVHLVPGVAYYVTVEACNGVFLCTRSTSSSLITDNSPPLPGQVQTGHSQEHSMYHSSRNSLTIKWENFHDPHSNIHHYEWCLSSMNSSCDVRPRTLAHLSTMQFLTDLNLSTSVQYVVEVSATNNVGLSVSAVSLPFIVDDSPPECLVLPQFDQSLSRRSPTQFDRSVVSLSWSFSDAESPVWTHSISLLTHHDGKVPLSKVVIGDVNHTSLSLSPAEQLQDGNRYVAKVDACNAAGLCTTAQSEEILIDSSPPEIGGFVEPLSWQNVGQNGLVTLSWYGFDDAHSGIDLYHIQIGSSFSGSDISGGILTVPHNDSTDIQQFTASLSVTIVPYTMVYLTIWAENRAGLLSDTAKVGVFVLKSGAENGKLDIEKHSCDFHYCNRDCTCAVLHRPCAAGDQIPDCMDALPLSVVQLTDGSPGHPVSITASSTCLQAFWSHIDTSVAISRYEWTVGLKGDEPGSPIYDLIHDKVWHDVDLQQTSLYCLPGNRSLSQGQTFVYYIKAWHDFDKFSMYESSGVLVDTTPPRVSSRWVREMDSTFTKELDFTTDTSVLYLDWTSVFRDAESGIDHYMMSVGTTSGGNEILGPVNMGNANRTVLEDLSLIPGQKYFATIHAYNSLGMLTSMTSDGIVVDLEVPLPGVVFTSASFKDAAHHREIIEVSWHGFEDLHSFIHHYEWAVNEPNRTSSQLQFTSCRLESSLFLSVKDLGLVEGEEYVVYVRAVDAAGHVSPVVTSNVFSVDESAPEGYVCSQPTLVLSNVSVSCEACDNSAMCSEKYRTCFVNESITLLAGQACMVTLHVGQASQLRGRLQLAHMFDWIHLSRDGPHSFTHSSIYSAQADETISPVVHQYAGDASNLTMDVFVCSDTTNTSNPLSIHQTGPVGVNLKWTIRDNESGIRAFRVGLGTSAGGFQLQPLTDVGVSSAASFPVSVEHGVRVYAVIVAEDNVGLTSAFSAGPLTIDWSPPVIENLQLALHEMGDGVFRVSASWAASDDESQLQDCHWALGLSSGSSDLMDFQLTDTLSSSSVSGIKLEHGDAVFVTVMCTNSVDLSQELTSEGTVVVCQPPLSSAASVHFHPQSHTDFPARRATQSIQDEVHFDFRGFRDVTGITGYEYMLTGAGDWQTCGMADYVIIDGLHVPSPSSLNVTVRAVNAGGLRSAARHVDGHIDTTAPKTTGSMVRHKLSGTDMELDWGSVFNTPPGSVYVVYVGVMDGAANFVTGDEMTVSKLIITSPLWQSPGECFIHVIAVAPSGEYVTHHQLIEY